MFQQPIFLAEKVFDYFVYLYTIVMPGAGGNRNEIYHRDISLPLHAAEAEKPVFNQHKGDGFHQSQEIFRLIIMKTEELFKKLQTLESMNLKESSSQASVPSNELGKVRLLQAIQNALDSQALVHIETCGPDSVDDEVIRWARGEQTSKEQYLLEQPIRILMESEIRTRRIVLEILRVGSQYVHFHEDPVKIRNQKLFAPAKEALQIAVQRTICIDDPKRSLN